jgi:catechol 2,3-dioxygenase-like lactoylglutathione lyase family enzyme
MASGGCRIERSGNDSDGAKDRRDYTTIISLPVQLSTKGSATDTIISHLVSRFEEGSLGRRELVRGVAMLAASGTAAGAREGLDFKDANIDYVSIHVADLQRSVDFYQKMFGFSVVSHDQAGGIIRLGKHQGARLPQPWRPCGHRGPLRNRDSSVQLGSAGNLPHAILTQRGTNPLEGDYAGLHIKDPAGSTC